MPGVEIGDGAVIAAHSVVTKSVPPYAIVAGNPATVKKYRFNKSVIKAIKESKWWEIPQEYVLTHLAPQVNDIEKFLQGVEEYRQNSCKF